MSLVIAAYVATFGTIALYAGRTVVRARQAAAALTASQPPSPED